MESSVSTKITLLGLVACVLLYASVRARHAARAALSDAPSHKQDAAARTDPASSLSDDPRSREELVEALSAAITDAAAQRARRIAAERAVRTVTLRSMLGGGTFPCVVIGYIRSPFRRRSGTPRQGLLAPASPARLELSREPLGGDASAGMPGLRVQPQSLDGLEAYSHAYLVFVFHENSDMHKRVQVPDGHTDADADAEDESSAARHGDGRRQRSFVTKVKPPGLGGSRTGVFATRTPHRPNPIGLSLVRILGVDTVTGVLRLAGVDLLDGTPILDIKPVNPADCGDCLWRRMVSATLPGAAEAGSSSCVNAFRCGGTRDDGCGGTRDDGCVATEIVAPQLQQRYPAWVHDSCFDARNRCAVTFSAEAAAALRDACEAGRCEFFSRSETATLMQALTQVLSLDIRDLRHGRGKGVSLKQQRVGDAQRFELFYDNFHLDLLYEEVAESGGAVTVEQHDDGAVVHVPSSVRVSVRVTAARLHQAPVGLLASAASGAAAAGDFEAE